MRTKIFNQISNGNSVNNVCSASTYRSITSRKVINILCSMSFTDLASKRTNAESLIH